MTSRQMLLLNNHKQNHQAKKNNYTNKKSGKRGNTDNVLEDEHERFVKYVPTDFKEDEVPVTDEEWRRHIKKSFKKKQDLGFLIDNSSDSSYNNLIADLQATDQYNKQIAEKKRWIKIKKKSKYGNVQRKGVPVNDRTYYIIVKSHNTKTGQRVSSYRRYYAVSTGKQISGGRLSRYVDNQTLSNIQMTRIDRIKHLKKTEHKKQSDKIQKMRKK